MDSLRRRNRRSIRSSKHDYRWAGLYFVTVCTHLRRCLLGQVVSRRMQLTEQGAIVQECLVGLPEHFPGLQIDSHVIMPNHVHALFGLHLPRPGADTPTLGAIVRHWKSMSCRLIRTLVDPSFGWQRNYHERILRNHEEIQRVRLYILQNPAHWDQDEDNPEVHAP